MKLKIFTDISRILVGSLFIFSGIIKANDPLGFSYKLEEYWVEFGMAWDWLLDLGVPLASFICILEIVLGVATLVAYRMRLVSWLLLLMIIFFSILTFASAVFGLVRSCGCFGDAIPLTPWQSFIKDLILLVFIVIIFIDRKNIHVHERKYKEIAFIVIPVTLMAWTSFKVDWNFPLYFTLIVLLTGFVVLLASKKLYPVVTVGLSAVFSLWFCNHVLAHLPMKDFRPYAVGKSIVEQMKLPENARPDVYRNIFRYKNKTTGEVKEFDENNLPWQDENFEFVDRETTLIEKGDEAKITDFSILDGDGNDVTQDILSDPQKVMLVICYNIDHTDDENASKIAEMEAACSREGIYVMGLSASDHETAEALARKMNWNFTFYTTDEITLKTIVRANPGLMLLQEGNILGKWHHNDVPDINELKAL